MRPSKASGSRPARAVSMNSTIIAPRPASARNGDARYMAITGGPGMAASPLHSPDIAPKTSTSAPRGVRLSRKPPAKIATVSPTSTAMASRTGAAGSTASAQRPKGVVSAAPSARRASEGLSATAQAPRSPCRLTASCKSITTGTTSAGGCSRLSSGMAAMAKPKPEKPRNRPAKNSMARLIAMSAMLQETEAKGIARTG